MKKPHILRFGAFSLLVLSSLGSVACSQKVEPFEDNALYDKEVATYKLEEAPLRRIELNTRGQMVEDGVLDAYFTNWKTIHVELGSGTFTRYNVYAVDKSYFANASEKAWNKRLVATGVPSSKSFNITSQKNIPINIWFIVEAIYENGNYSQKPVSAKYLYKDSNFVSKYTYSGNDLGVTYSKESSTFKVWAPAAGCVYVKLLNGDAEPSYYPMSFHQGVVWACTIEGDLEGKDYVYSLYNANGLVTAQDPYAKATRNSGKVSSIVDFSKTNPEGWDALPLKWDGVSGRDLSTPQELSIYETHVRDVTMHETWTGTSKRGTFKALAEKGTTYSDGVTTVKTGFDHIEELGVTAVQFLPSFDYDNNEAEDVFNWGYNPLNYNCVEGLYSTDPTNASTRIKEFKELILALANNNNKTRTIMDVVYNHVSWAPTSCFEQIMPDYYFRKDSNWDYYNGALCQNEVKSEAPMMSKYIVDSLIWWASEYKVKGFRFDLMGLIDCNTIKKAAQELYKIDPDIYLYGEGWTAAGYHGDDATNNPGAISENVYSRLYKQGNMCYVGGFNDAGRNALKGDNSGNMWGFLSQGSEDVGEKSGIVSDMLLGKNTWAGANPLQTINYASCHDNFTLFDQFSLTTKDTDGWKAEYLPYAMRDATIANIAVMMSNGAAFMQGGEELFRSKQIKSAEDLAIATEGDKMVINDLVISHNSYNLSDDVNAYDWSRKISINYKGAVENAAPYFNALKKAIEIRKDLKFKSNSENPSSGTFRTWETGNGCTKIALHVDSKTNSSRSYRLCIAARYDEQYLHNDHGTNLASIGSVTLRQSFDGGSNNGVRMGKYSCVITTDD